MTKKIMQTFYFATTLILYSRSPGILTTDYSQSEFVSFAYLLNFFSRPEVIIFIFSIAAFLTLAWCLLTLNIMSRVLVFLLISILFYTGFSFGKVNLHQNSWIMFSFLMIFFKPDKELNEKTNRYLLDFVQMSVLATYFISGLWKLRTWLTENSWENFYQTVLDYFSYPYIEGTPRLFFIDNLLMNYHWLLITGFIFVVIFQLSMVVPIFFWQYRMHWGFAICAFHFIVGCTMGIWFTEQFVACCFFLIYVPVIQRE